MFQYINKHNSEQLTKLSTTVNQKQYKINPPPPKKKKKKKPPPPPKKKKKKKTFTFVKTWRNKWHKILLVLFGLNGSQLLVVSYTICVYEYTCGFAITTSV